MNFAGVKAITIPEGDVKSIAIGGATVWEKPSQIPYVADGLVAWWDGIWNAGIGVHDATATVWRDLAGGNDATWQGPAFSASTWHWLADGFDFSATDANKRYWKTGAASSAVRDAINSGAATLEFAAPRLANNGCIIHIANDTLVDNLVAVFANDNLQFAIHRAWNNGRSNLAFARNSAGSAAYVATAFSVAGKQFKNGSLKGNGATPDPSAADAASNAYIALGGFASSSLTSSGRNYQGSINCIRIYNRALTDAEVAANYAADKERFGLP